jgi:decaprenyl-phosphate phosphoribosyltransferase
MQEIAEQPTSPLANAGVHPDANGATPVAPAVTVEAPPGATAKVRALARACRPRQWTKNVLVFAAPGAAGVLFHAGVPGRVLVAFLSFCLLSSSTYLLNDVHDRVEDALDPKKRSRPIASGDVSVRLAVWTAVALAAAGLILAAAVRPALAGVGAGYLVLTASYTFWLRNVAVADIAAVTAGFVIRAIAGGVAVDVPVSRWFLIVTSFGALFLVAGKRYGELLATAGANPQLESAGTPGGQPLSAPIAHTPGPSAAAGRPVRAPLLVYSTAYLRFVMILAAAVTVGAYCLWAFGRPGHGVAVWYDLTIVPFVLWLLRYALLVDQGLGTAPEELVLNDGFLLTMSFAWVAIFAGAVYVGG